MHLRDEIQKVKEMTDKPFGVNFAIGQHGRPFSHMVEAALEEGVKVMSVTGGNPTPFFDQLKDTDVKTARTRRCKKASRKSGRVRCRCCDGRWTRRRRSSWT